MTGHENCGLFVEMTGHENCGLFVDIQQRYLSPAYLENDSS